MFLSFSNARAVLQLSLLLHRQLQSLRSFVPDAANFTSFTMAAAPIVVVVVVVGTATFGLRALCLILNTPHLHK